MNGGDPSTSTFTRCSPLTERLILRLEDHPIAMAEGEDTGDVDAVTRVAQRKGAAVALIVHTYCL